MEDLLNLNSFKFINKFMNKSCVALNFIFIINFKVIIYLIKFIYLTLRK